MYAYALSIINIRLNFDVKVTYKFIILYNNNFYKDYVRYVYHLPIVTFYYLNNLVTNICLNIHVRIFIEKYIVVNI